MIKLQWPHQLPAEVPQEGHISQSANQVKHLLIGPGSGTDKKGDTKVLNISNLETINCTLPLIKHGYYGYVATDTADGPMLCGGKGFGLDHQSYCYVFTKEGIWVALPPVMGMKKKRSFAAAIEFDGSWWVTGISLYHPLDCYSVAMIQVGTMV